MIKIEIANEKVIHEPERTVTFEFRRHAAHSPGTEQQVFLVALDVPGRGDLYPLKIDGRTKKVHVRRVLFDALGFEVVME